MPDDEKGKCKMSNRARYDKALPAKMYSYFTSCDTGTGAPSFSKFARTVRLTLDELESFRKNKKFDKAYRECSKIRRDYLIDCALSKRFDSSFTKFILSSEFSMGEKPEEADRQISVILEVVD